MGTLSFSVRIQLQLLIEGFSYRYTILLGFCVETL